MQWTNENSNYMKLTWSAGKSVRTSHKWWWFTSDWMKKWGEIFKPIMWRGIKCVTNHLPTLKWELPLKLTFNWSAWLANLRNSLDGLAGISASGSSAVPGFPAPSSTTGGLAGGAPFSGSSFDTCWQENRKLTLKWISIEISYNNKGSKFGKKMSQGSFLETKSSSQPFSTYYLDNAF